jgi:hypothetical protein
MLFGGCVLYVHDSKIKQLKPANAELKDFIGTFKNDAIYFTPPNAVGLEGHDTLEGALGLISLKSNVQIELTNTQDIIVKSTHVGGASLRYVKGKDFDFTNCCIFFHGESHVGGEDSPGFGVYKTSMIWMLNDSGNLVIVSGSKGTGFATIIPVVVGGSTFSVFSRTQD